MRDALARVGFLPVEPVLAALAQCETLYALETLRQDAPGSPHGDTSSIFLRGPPVVSVDAMITSLEAVNYPEAEEPEFATALAGLRSLVARPLARAMITRLKPGGFITKHTDQGAYALATDRYHWCIASNETAWCAVDRVMAVPSPGEVWSFDKHRPHSCANLGATPRVHLIFDVWRGLTFEEERFSSLRDEGAALFEAHYREASADLSVPLEVDWAMFERLEDAGMEVCIAARDRGRLIGYAVYILHPHLHYRGLSVAEVDVFFLNPADRRGSTGMRLFRAAERVLALRGVQEIWNRVKLHVKPGRGRSDLGPLFRRLGYRAVETTYRKRIV